MRTTKSIPTVLLLAAAAFSWPKTETAIPGPGAVVTAVKQLLAAQSAADAAALSKVLDVTGDHLYGFDLDAAGKPKEVTENATMTFYDVTADGKALAASSADGATQLLLAAAGTRTLRSIRANCHSAECSMATCEFDHTVGTGDKATTTKMRATALLRYDDKLHGFRVFHWHASPAAAH